jgi:hypothetical protein
MDLIAREDEELTDEKLAAKEKEEELRTKGRE